MKNSKQISLILLILFLIFNFTFTVSAHPGNTDSNGGHRDSSTGIYHYHHGYTAHQHTDGECPYNFDVKSNNKVEAEDIGTIAGIISLIIIFCLTIFYKFGDNIIDFFKDLLNKFNKIKSKKTNNKVDKTESTNNNMYQYNEVINKKYTSDDLLDETYQISKNLNTGVFRYVDNESHIVNITAFISDLINQFYGNKKSGYECFIREILYFSQLYVINSFKNISYTVLREDEFLPASRYLVGINFSTYQSWLLCNNQEKENIQTIIKNNNFTELDIDILCKILFVVYQGKGYAPISTMLSIFYNLDKKDYDKFELNFRSYICELIGQIDLLSQYEKKRFINEKESRRKAIEESTDLGITHICFKEPYTLYIM